MASNVYECMFILDPNRYARDPNGVAGQIPTMIEQAGGEVLASRLWNEQRLAYPIAGHRKGAYWLTYFRMPSERVAQFDRACRLNENVLRNLTLQVDHRLADTLVAHARGEAVPDPNAQVATEEPEPDAHQSEPKDED
ncbi:MAG: 30S ribosomal protein S6 [Planctomycetota bacterium]